MDLTFTTNELEIYVLTHKKITENYDNTLYKPIVNGSALSNEDFGYLRDDIGENISKLNPYFAELTGQYCVWKNSKANIIGFCHYRRWFVKNIFFNKLNKEDICTDLQKNDIILPQKTRLLNTVKEKIKKDLIDKPNYGPKIKDYEKLESYIKKNYYEYYPSFKKIMNGKEIYNNNMFICSKEIANDYFNWLFTLFDGFKKELDLDKYPKNNKRVFGFFSELLLTVYVKKNNLKIKEHYIYLNERKLPILHIINRRFPSAILIEKKISRHNK